MASTLSSLLKNVKEFPHLTRFYQSSSVVCEEIKKVKGVKKGIVAKEIMLDDYKEVLFTGKPQYGKMNMIRSERHDIYTNTVNKKALSADDDKRMIMDDGISTKAIGHYSTLSACRLT
jgi:hypothetical protein